MSADLLHAATALTLLLAGVYLNDRVRRPKTPSWHSLLTRRHRARTFLLFAFLFLAAALTVVLTNLYRALIPQFGEHTPWAFAPFLLASLALVLTPFTRLWISRRRRSRPTGSQN